MAIKSRFLKAMFDIQLIDNRNKPARYTVPGYVVDLYGYTFGVWNDGGKWSLVDLGTGMRLSGCKPTRKNAIEWFTPNVLEAYERTIHQQYYADLVREFEQMHVQPF